MKFLAPIVLLLPLTLTLTCCNTVSDINHDRPVTQVDTYNDIAEINRICEVFGVVKIPGSIAVRLIPVPYAATAADIIAAGVDKVCADPGKFVHDSGTVAWVFRNLRKN